VLAGTTAPPAGEPLTVAKSVYDALRVALMLENVECQPA